MIHYHIYYIFIIRALARAQRLFLFYDCFFCQGLYIGTLKCRGSIIVYIHLGAGKHPSPLDISESNFPDLYLKVGFYLIKKYCSCPKLSQFKEHALL